MDEQLLSFLEYDGIIGALVSTPDGLVVATGGLDEQDAEVIAATGSALRSALATSGEPSGAMDVAGGSLHVLPGEEISLLVLAEEGVAHEAVLPLMEETLESVAGALS